jgi:D-arabinose 1-dehydrogenase-like Zn-dependent alcohol dehydrogenase
MGRAVLFHGCDRPLELRRFATPQSDGAEVLVRVTCCTLCASDLHTHAGRRMVPTPTVLGHEIVGRIEAVWPDGGAARFPWPAADGWRSAELERGGELWRLLLLCE